MRRPTILLALIALAACTRAATVQSPTPSGGASTSVGADLLARARAIHARAITIDTHKDIPDNFATAAADPLNMPSQVNLEKMRLGGYDVAFFAVYVGQGARTDSGNAVAKDRALNKFSAIHRMAEQMYPSLIEIAYTAADVERIAASGKLVAAIGIENGWVVGKDLSLIQRYHELGARYMTLAHTSNNDICDSSTDQRGPEWKGLSPFGRQVVAEMNRVGMMVDISHVSKDCMMQATALSTSPVIASHSSTTHEAPVPRNLDDEQLLAIKKNGGVAQMVALAGYVRQPQPVAAERQRAIDGLRAEYFPPDPNAAAGRGGRGGGAACGGGRGGRGAAALPAERQAQCEKRMSEINVKYPPAPRPSVVDFIDHVDHAVKVAGIDHVGISSDFDGGGGIDGWNDATETFNITLELVRRGYSEENIRKLWGGNTLRVWEENRKRARPRA